MENLTDAQLTELYKQANNIPDGKPVPITTTNIFRAMRTVATINAERLLLVEGLLKEAKGHVDYSACHVGNFAAQDLKERIENAKSGALI